MKYLFVKVIGILVGSFLLFGIAPASSAQISYPIKELGNCRDAKECFYYCEVSGNTPACWSYDRYKLNGQVLGETAEQLGITFPIAELGNCASKNECMKYCNIPENQSACISFGKKKGLIKEKQPKAASTIKSTILESAKQLLGCNSETTCRTFCQQPENRSRCEEFAQKQGLTKPQEKIEQENTTRTQLMEEAKTEFGCTDEKSCKDFCSQPANFGKCQQFSQSHGLKKKPSQEETSSFSEKKEIREIDEVRKIRNCDGEESCRKYCKENPDKCPGFTSSKSFLGPNGCRSSEECKEYCKSHPAECPGFPATEQKRTEFIKKDNETTFPRTNTKPNSTEIQRQEEQKFEESKTKNVQTE